MEYSTIKGMYDNRTKEIDFSDLNRIGYRIGDVELRFGKDGLVSNLVVVSFVRTGSDADSYDLIEKIAGGS